MPLSSSNRLWDETSNSRSQSTRFYVADFQLVVLPITKVDRREERTFPTGDCELSRKVSWDVAFATVVISHAHSKAVAITKPRFPRFQNGEYVNTANIGLGMIFCLIFVGWGYKLSAVGVQGSIPTIRGQKPACCAAASSFCAAFNPDHSRAKTKSHCFGQAQGPAPAIGFSLLGCSQ